MTTWTLPFASGGTTESLPCSFAAWILAGSGGTYCLTRRDRLLHRVGDLGLLVFGNLAPQTTWGFRIAGGLAGMRYLRTLPSAP